MYIYLTNIIGFFFDLLVISICSNKWNEYAIIFGGAIIIFLYKIDLSKQE